MQVTRRRAFASRVSTGHVVMVLAGALGVLLTLSVLRAADDTRPMLAAARDIPAGTVLDARSLRVTSVHVDGDVQSTLFDASALGIDEGPRCGRAHLGRCAADAQRGAGRGGRATRRVR